MARKKALLGARGTTNREGAARLILADYINGQMKFCSDLPESDGSAEENEEEMSENGEEDSESQ